MTLDGVEHTLSLPQRFRIEIRPERPQAAHAIGVDERANSCARLGVQGLIRVHVSAVILGARDPFNYPYMASMLVPLLGGLRWPRVTTEVLGRLIALSVLTQYREQRKGASPTRPGAREEFEEDVVRGGEAMAARDGVTRDEPVERIACESQRGLRRSGCGSRAWASSSPGSRAGG